MKQRRFRQQPVIIRQKITGHRGGAVEFRRVPVAPAGILAGVRLPGVPDIRIVPAQHETDPPLRFRRQRQPAGNRTGVAPVFGGRLRIITRRQRTGPGKVIPEHIDLIHPGAAIPVPLNRSVAGIGRHRQFAVKIAVGRMTALFQHQTPAGNLMPTAVGRIVYRKRHGIIDRTVSRILEFDLKGGRRQRRIEIVRRNERIERPQFDRARKGRLLKRNRSQRKFAVETGIAKMRHPRQQLPVGAETEAEKDGSLRRLRHPGVRRRQIAVQHPGVDQPPVRFRLDGKMAVAVMAQFIGMIGDLPVDQPPRTGQADAAGADAAERKGNHAALVAGILHFEQTLF